ncbi:hypothetical protein [Pararhizobium sp. PWRC1-1]|uniref:hypothetical protein n=1 Tax=Pararhizobium sp. PWRC1-1 TaxID=2804566 RepID=UPI003CEE4D6F
MTRPEKDKESVKAIHGDAKGQYARGLKRSDNNGVTSAKPRVITGSDDATAHKVPPGSKPAGKEWDLNYNEREMKEGDFKG